MPVIGRPVTVTLAIVPSMSVPVRLTPIVVSSGVVNEPAVAVGASLTDVTLMSTDAVEVPPLPSLIVYVKDAGPL